MDSVVLERTPEAAAAGEQREYEMALAYATRRGRTLCGHWRRSPLRNWRCLRELAPGQRVHPGQHTL